MAFQVEHIQSLWYLFDGPMANGAMGPQSWQNVHFWKSQMAACDSIPFLPQIKPWIARAQKTTFQVFHFKESVKNYKIGLVVWSS